MAKPVKSFRLEPELIELSERAGINLTELFEAAMAKALKLKRCPYCQSPISHWPKNTSKSKNYDKEESLS